MIHTEEKQEKCSVVIPAKNAAAYIDETLRSVLSQTMPPHEILVVDDYSTDCTAKIVRSFNCHSVKYITNRAAGGASQARNLGAYHATGERIAFLDADDVYLPNHLESMNASLEQHADNAMVFCDAEYMDAFGALIGLVVRFPEFNKDAFFGQLLERNRIVSTSATMIRKKQLLKMGGFDENLKFNEEYDLWIRLSASFPVGHSSQATLRYRLHPDNISRNQQGQQKNEALALQKLSVFQIRAGLSRLYSDIVAREIAVASVLFRRESYSESLSVLEDVYTDSILSQQYYFIFGNLKFNAMDYSKATEYYKKALAVKPDFTPAINNLGVTFALAGDTAIARALFQRACSLRNDYNDPVFNMHIIDCGCEATKMRITLCPLRDVLKPR